MKEARDDRPSSLQCFTPEWSGFEWNLVHDSGKKYTSPELLVDLQGYVSEGAFPLYLTYFGNAWDHSRDELSPLFFMVWLNMCHELDALFYAEEKRREYMAENPKKGKQSEGVYAAALQKYSDRYKEMK